VHQLEIKVLNTLHISDGGETRGNETTLETYAQMGE